MPPAVSPRPAASSDHQSASQRTCWLSASAGTTSTHNGHSGLARIKNFNLKSQRYTSSTCTPCKATLVGLTGLEGARTIAVSHASNSRRQAP